MAYSLRQAIRDNQRFHKYEKLLRQIRLRVFEYEDSGRSEKAERVIAHQGNLRTDVGETGKTTSSQGVGPPAMAVAPGQFANDWDQWTVEP